MAAVVTTPKIAATMGRALHFNTFGGNPMASVVGSAVLDVLEEDGCQAVARDIGTYLILELAKLRDEFEIVGDVRGKGLAIGIEFVTDKESKDPLPQDEFMSLWENLKLKGILTGKGGLNGNVIRIKPPLCINKDDADFTVAVLRKALNEHVDGIRV
jgi:alanine-glyoxylate transaminase/(R)-3-amino-2-methylpropionate-pyruvate transaminase